MIEGSFHLFKHDFLKGQPITDKQQLSQKVEAFITHCRNRYFGELYGLTPLQILKAAIPDKNHFKEQIQQAAMKRRIDNKQFSCILNQCR